MSSKPYQIHRGDKFDRQLNRLPEGQRKKIESIIEDELKVNPYTYGQLLKANLGNMGWRKIRVGDYRLVYVIRENPVKIVALLGVEHRSSVYRD